MISSQNKIIALIRIIPTMILYVDPLVKSGGLATGPEAPGDGEPSAVESKPEPLQCLRWSAVFHKFVGVAKINGPSYRAKIVGLSLSRHPRNGAPDDRNSHVVLEKWQYHFEVYTR